MKECLRIGNLEIASRVLIAPMSGITDLPFRRVLQKFSPGYVVSEMVAGKKLVEGNEDTALRASGAGEIDPLVIQLVGNDMKWMGEGSARAEELGADIVDINMGCPARKVVTGAAGSALMRDLDKACDLISAVVSNTARPVTLKMRLGWSHEQLNAAELASKAEALGVSAVIVHGRTRCQFYEGVADWSAVKTVSDAVSIPVIVNGDIDSGDAARRALEASGADAVMVGRSLTGQPWLVSTIKRGLGETVVANVASKADVAAAHYTDVIETFGERRGVRVARKHVQAYLQNAGASKTTLKAAMTEKDPEIVRAHLISSLNNEAVAA